MRAMNEKDRQLSEAVTRQLEWDPQVTSNDISVAAADHVITLTGFVHNFNEKYAAENAAKSVYGVQVVANDIEVKLKASRTDPEIARDEAHGIKLDVTVPEMESRQRFRTASLRSKERRSGTFNARMWKPAPARCLACVA